MPSPRPDPESPIRTALAQLPAVAGAWLLYGVLLSAVLLGQIPVDLVSAPQRAAVFLGLLLLLLLEVAFLVLAIAAFELLGRRLLPAVARDAVVATALAAGLGLLAASALKYRTTGVHLKRSDLWFLRTNLVQILEEALIGELAAVLALPAATLLLAGLLVVALYRLRSHPPQTSARALGALAAVAAAGLAAILALSPPARIFASNFVPETYWLGRALPAAGAKEPTAGGGGSGEPGPAIVPYRPAADPARPNVVLVMLESIPWKHSGLASADGGRTVPHLARLARESVILSRAYATSSHSDYAQMSILSSLYPRKYDHHDYYTRIAYPRALLWDALREAGYTTGMFSCQNERWGNMLSFLDTPGLEILRHSPSWPRAPHKGRGAESKVYEETPVREWMRWRREGGGEPYFTYFNFQSNHFPYEPPADAPRPFAPHRIDFAASFLSYPREQVPLMLNRFRNALHYADRWIGEIEAFLRQQGEWERTALVVVSDHGEAFYEHGQPTHGTSLYEEQLRSLWLMRLPGEPPRRIDEAVSLLDLAPTLLAYLGLPPHGNFQGRSDLLEPSYSAAGRPLFFTIQGLTFEDGLLLDGWKYIVNWDRRERRLFDLEADPGESADLLAEQPERARELDGHLRRMLTRQLDYYRAQGWRGGRYPAPLP